MKTENVSFKGYQNVLHFPIVSGPDYMPVHRGFRFVAQVTDDFAPDLTEWKPFLEKFPDRKNDNFLTLDYVENADSVGLKLNSDPLIDTINNVPLFKLLSKFLSRLCTEDKAVEIKTFKLTKDFQKSLDRLSDYETDIDELSESEIETIRDKDSIQEVASHIHEEILSRLVKITSKQKA